MNVLEKVLLGMLALIALFLVVNAPQASQVIQSIGGTGAGLVGTLQGRNAVFRNAGVTIGGGLGTPQGGAAEWGS